MRLCALSISFNYEQSLGAHFLRKAEKITFQNLSSYFELLEHHPMHGGNFATGLQQLHKSRTDFVQAKVCSGNEVQQDGFATQPADRYLVGDSHMVRKSQGMSPSTVSI